VYRAILNFDLLISFWEISALITLADLLEAIVGDIPHLDEKMEADTIMREGSSWLICGILPIDDFGTLFGIDRMPKGENGLYQTIGGLHDDAP
jgi:putative hemolysin